MPLGEIRAVLESPEYDRKAALRQQKRLLDAQENASGTPDNQH